MAKHVEGIPDWLQNKPSLTEDEARNLTRDWARRRLITGRDTGHIRSVLEEMAAEKYEDVKDFDG